MAAAFPSFLSASLGRHLEDAARQANVVPAAREELNLRQSNEGALAMIEGQAFAFGRLRFLREMEVEPHQADVIAGEWLERAGYAAYFVISLTRSHCIGVVGVRSLPDTAS